MNEQTKELMGKIQEPLKIEPGYSAPELKEYVQRLDDLFGFEWNIDAKGVDNSRRVACEIDIYQEGSFIVRRVAIADDFEEAFRLCCKLIGIGRHKSG